MITALYNSLNLLAAIALLLASLSMPILTAIGLRMIFKRSNKNLLAALTAIPFTVGMITVSPGMDKIQMSIFTFGMMYLMAYGGIRIADRIRKRNSNRSNGQA